LSYDFNLAIDGKVGEMLSTFRGAIHNLIVVLPIARALGLLNALRECGNQALDSFGFRGNLGVPGIATFQGIAKALN
jgi:hypothetical protein